MIRRRMATVARAAVRATSHFALRHACVAAERKQTHLVDHYLSMEDVPDEDI